MVTIEQRLFQIEHENLWLRDLFARSTAQSQTRRASGYDQHLPYREAERHMPAPFDGRGHNFAEFAFKVEA